MLDGRIIADTSPLSAHVAAEGWRPAQEGPS
jgi:hypothetical protein